MKEYIKKQDALEKIKNYKGYFQDQESTDHMILKLEAQNIINDIEGLDVIHLDIPIGSYVYSIFNGEIIEIHIENIEIGWYDTYYMGSICYLGIDNTLKFEKTDIGESIFMTEEEAIKKLKEIKEKNIL